MVYTMNITDLTTYTEWLKGKIDFTKHSSDILNFLVKLAKHYGSPLYFTSSFRTPKQNVTCGGSPTSSHLKGLAFDIKCTNSSERYHLLEALFFYGVRRIGIYKNFIHIDFDPDKPAFVAWYV